MSREQETGNSASLDRTHSSPIQGGNNQKESTRSWLATSYVIGYLIVIAATLWYMLYVGSSVDEIKDLLLAISGVLSGPLGFIIGYYFKAVSENE